MDNDIREAYCSFEVSKLLKEICFDIPTDVYRVLHNSGRFEWIKEGDLLFENEFLDETSCPTHALAIEWIRVNFKYHIYTYLVGIGYYCYIVQKIQTKEPKELIVQTVKDSIVYDELYNSPQEAMEVGLLYTLQYLTNHQTDKQ